MPINFTFDSLHNPHLKNFNVQSYMYRSKEMKMGNEQYNGLDMRMSSEK